MKGILATLLEEAFANIALAKSSVVREQAFPTNTSVIKVAIGMRRAGKTHFLYQQINQLLSEGVHQQQILFIDFEDDRLLPMSAKEMGRLIDTFYELYPDNYDRMCYLFLDEIQNIPDWQQVVRRFHNNKNIQLYLTGSSAKLLSSEIETSLRGRSLAVEVFPYSFDEYLLAHDIAKPQQPFGKKTLDIMRTHLLEYFATGGFPAVQSLPKGEWRDTLQTYVDTVTLRDIIERYDLSNISLLKYLITTLLKNCAAPFSVNKFYNDIKSQGYKVSKDTIHTYLSYIEDTFLIMTVPHYSESARTKQTTPKKIYAVDNGLIRLMALGTNDIMNKLLENQIYLDLRRQGKQVYFYHTSDGYEVDFVAIDKDGNRELIQVTVDMDAPETAAREQRALQQAQKELGFKGRIITLSDYLYHCGLPI